MTQVERVAGFQKATATAPAKTTGQRILRGAALAVLAAVVAAGIIFWLLRQEKTADRLLTLYGNIDIREIAVAFNDNGPVTRMLMQEGDRVHKGQLIAEMDDRRYVAALDQAEGQMRNQEQVLARLVAGSRPEEIAQAKATMEALSITYQNDEVIYRRAETLLRTGAGTTKERDDTKAAFDAARQQYEAARQAYILAEKGPRAEDIAAQRAAYEAAQGTVALDKRELADTKLYAPADGIVEDRILEPGDMASPSTAVYTIALTNPLWVRAYVPETALGKVMLGMRATIGTDSFPGRTYRGWIGYLGADRGIHTQERRDAGVTHAARLSVARLCLRSGQRFAAWNAGHRRNRSVPTAARAEAKCGSRMRG